MLFRMFKILNTDNKFFLCSEILNSVTNPEIHVANLPCNTLVLLSSPTAMSAVVKVPDAYLYAV
jgi:hypothetical protein